MFAFSSILAIIHDNFLEISARLEYVLGSYTVSAASPASDAK